MAGRPRQQVFDDASGPCSGESGNIFFTLFGAIALIAVIGVATSALIRGPVRTMVMVNMRTKADSQLQITRKLAALEATSNIGDCDGDNFIEPAVPDTTSSGCIGLLSGGGCIPSTVGAAKTDPWGTQVGYCAWNHGSQPPPNPGGCPAGLLNGTDATNKTVIAVISAGPDRVFQTTCADDPVYAMKGGDDIVDEWTFDEAQSMGGGGLWTLQSGRLTPTGAQDVNISNNATFASGKTATFEGNANFAFGSQLSLANGGLFNLPTQVTMPDGMCTAATAAVNDGVLRINTTTGRVIEICDPTQSGPMKWVAVGGSGSTLKLDDLVDAVSDFGTGDNVFLGSSGGGNLISGALRNTAVGISSGAALTNGKDNVLLGYNAGKYIDTGDGNIFIGSSSTSAMDGTAAATNTLNIGGTIFGTGLYTRGSGSIGINTATPGATLDVNGSMRAITGAFTGTLIAGGAVTASSTLDVEGATSLGGTLSVADSVSSPGGTVSVASNLDTIGNGAFSGTLTVGGATTINSTLHVNGSTALDSDLDVLGHAVVTGDVAAADYRLGPLTSGIGLFTDGANGLQLSTNSIKRLQITSGGAVGVGVSSPATELDVGGAIRIGGETSSCGPGLYGAIRYTSSTDKVQACSNTNAWVTIGTSGGGGGGGIGAAGADTQIQFNNNNVFGADSSLVWDYSNRRLGVGTAAPANVVDVMNASPTVAITNSTPENADYGRKSSVLFRGTAIGGAVNDIGQITASQDADNTQGLFSTQHAGQLSFYAEDYAASSLVEMMKINSYRIHSLGHPFVVASGPSGTGLGNQYLNIRGNAAAGLFSFINFDSNTQRLAINNIGNEGVEIKTSAGIALVVDENGNVGIGTVAPGLKLDVAGTLRIGNGGEVCAGGTAGAIRYNAGGIL